ncbi:MAG: hypothetical protein Q8J68_14655 [Methanolobus sp.]|nr:hypothetical protein [Methanolobus sp.]
MRCKKCLEPCVIKINGKGMKSLCCDVSLFIQDEPLGSEERYTMPNWRRKLHEDALRKEIEEMRDEKTKSLNKITGEVKEWCAKHIMKKP